MMTNDEGPKVRSQRVFLPSLLNAHTPTKVLAIESNPLVGKLGKILLAARSDCLIDYKTNQATQW